MDIKVIYFSFFILISSILYASDPAGEIGKVVEYKGYKGDWIENNNPEKIDYFIKTYGSGYNDIVNLNGKDFRKKNKIFMPFSEAYMEYLKSRESIPPSVSKYDFIWPVEKVDRVTSTFGKRWSSFHEGIDIPASRGLPVFAVCNGRVAYGKFIDNLGNTICVEHRDNIFTRYAHLSQIIVKEGEIVKKGQVIGYAGSTGNSTGNHLHFEVRFGDFPMNPLDFLPFHSNVTKAQYMKKLD
jgi:murein DD-endopeptidase MepM/ murein hydrolase activator NlpD